MLSINAGSALLHQSRDAGRCSASPARDEPLSGRHVAITWSLEEGPIIASHLEAAGAHVTPLFAGAIEPVGDTSALDAALQRVSRYDWIVLTSLSGVDVLAQRLAALGLGPDASRHVYIAMLFPVTARTRQLATVPLQLVPTPALAEDIEAGLRELAGKKLLLLRAEHMHDTLAEVLCRRGAEVDEVSAYRMVARAVDAPSLQRVLTPGRTDAIMCTSAVMADGLLAGLAALGQEPSEALRSIPLIALDPAAATTLRRAGLAPAIALSSLPARYAAAPSLRTLVATVASALSLETPPSAALSESESCACPHSSLRETGL